MYDVNLLQLKYFYVVALEGSFTKAALRLKIAQPAISKMIKQLEENIQSPLLYRSNGEVSLTHHGKIAFEYSHRIFENAEALQRELKILPVTEKKQLRIGTNDFLAAHFFPEIIDELKTGYPEVYPILQVGTATFLCELVADRKLDFALLFHVPDLTPKLSLKMLKAMRFHLVASKAFRDAVDVLNNFIGSREVDEEGVRRFPTLSKWRQIQPDAEIQCSTNSLLTQLELVKRGNGIAVLPKMLVEGHIKSGRLVDLLPKEKLYFSAKIVTHKDFKGNSVNEWLIRTIERNITDK